MNSSIALLGGETFTEDFKEVHMHLINLARSTRADPDDRPVRVVYLVTCASHDGAERIDYLRERAQKNLGRKNLGLMGAQVTTPPVIDRQSADNLEYARMVAEADWIYFSGGLPHIGMRILSGSRVLDAIFAAFERGVLISGSSAGAMMLCSQSIVITPEMNAEIEKMIKRGEGHTDWMLLEPSIEKCLGLVPRSMCWPHRNILFSAKFARSLLPSGHRFIGIDEKTAAVKDTMDRWLVRGTGKVVIGAQNDLWEYASGTEIDL
jgi:cyanophycinase-like exopeptidase